METSRRSATLAAVFVGVLCSQTPVRAEAPPTNYELVRSTAHSASAQLVGALGQHANGRVLALRGVGASSANFLVENALSSALTEAGWQVLTRADSTVGQVLEFEVVDLGLEYVHTYRNSWFGEKRVEREARTRLFARLVDMTQSSVVWADQAEERQRDEVAVKALGALEDKNPPDYLKASLPPQRWNKIVEPVVVTGIIAGLIILFFSNQSTSQ